MQIRAANSQGGGGGSKEICSKKTTDGRRKKGGPAIEEIYTKLGELDHILKRPDTFVGSTEKVTEETMVYDEGLQLLRPLVG